MKPSYKCDEAKETWDRDGECIKVGLIWPIRGERNSNFRKADQLGKQKSSHDADQ
jgi:hypothetical protein